MKRYLVFLNLLGLCLLSTAWCAPLQLHVAVNGNDSWSGRMATAQDNDGPLASLEGARQAIRSLKQAGAFPEGGIEVLVHAGLYSMDAPFALTEEDSGTAQAPIVYQAAPGEKVRLLGGVVVSDFKAVEDPSVLARMDEAAHGNVMTADLKALGFTEFGSPKGGGVELFFDEKPMTLSRWPNTDFVRIVDIVEKDGHEIHGQKGSKTGRFIYKGTRPERWVNEEDVWLHGYWFWDWSEERQQVVSIDTEHSQISLSKPYHHYGYRKDQWYYAYNLLPELDTPGEWYLDRDAGMLYFWPPEKEGAHTTIVSRLNTMITLNSVSHVHLKGFSMEGVRGDAVLVSKGADTKIIGCTIFNTGGYAVKVNEGKRHGVIGCDIYQTGCGGITMAGGNRTTLEPAGHYAENNHIHHYARIARVYHPGVRITGVGNRIEHNLIHNAPHMAIGFTGNDHLIALNEIHSVCYESNDAGAIYTGRNWTMRGNMLRNNYLHHINGFEGGGCVGIYLDDMFSSADMIGNVFYKVTRAAFIGGGRDCTIANNIFVDCNPALHVDARAMGWAHGHADQWIKEATEKGTLSGIAYNKPPYSTRYPQLVNILDDGPKAPKGNTIARNIFWGGEWDGVRKEARKYLKFKKNFINKDPHFVDEAHQDFRLKDDSPVYKKGFQPIPIEKIGLYNSPQRASWPVQHTVRPMH